MLLGLSAGAETWTPVGQVQWTEGAMTGWRYGYNITWSISIERSDTRAGVFRMQPYASNSSYAAKSNVYIYLHTEDSEKIYMEYYWFRFSSDYYYNVWQRCPENGFDSKYYGKFIDEWTIEFPIGSFIVDEEYDQAEPLSAPSSNAILSTCVHKIVFPEGVLDYKPTPETWVSLGKGTWEDCFFNKAKKEVKFERSMIHEDVFRAYPYGDEPVYIHTEDASKIWIDEFSAEDYKITQKCSENGSNSSKYGTMTNGVIEIPSDYFSCLNTSSNQTQTVWDKTLVITLPEGYNTPIDDDNGIMMGIISFNDNIDNLPIMPLNRYTEPLFIKFVNNMEMENATLLYYAVDQAITSLGQPEYPDNLSKAVLITFTDGLDQGSLAMKPEQLTSRNYAQYLSDRISTTTVQGQPLQAYTIGLKSSDVADDELFMLNLESLSSAPENAHSVTDIEGVQTELTKIYEDLYRQTSQRVVSMVVPMMSHGDRYRFTLDSTVDPNKVNDSKMWIEGVFDITDFSLNDIQYHGFTSDSGEKVYAERNGVYIKFAFTDCRDTDGEILEIEKSAIDQWTYIPSSEIWQHNIENDKDDKIAIEDIRTSAAVMFVLDCSRSLGDLFPVLKETANTFIDRLAGGDGDYSDIDLDSIDEVTSEENAPVEFYNLQGIKVTNPQHGLYIRRQGKTVSKVLVK